MIFKRVIFGIFCVASLISCGSGSKNSAAKADPPVQAPVPEVQTDIPKVEAISAWLQGRNLTLEFPEKLQNVRVRFSTRSNCDLSIKSDCANENIINDTKFNHELPGDAQIVYYRFENTSKVSTYVLRLQVGAESHPAELSTAVFAGRTWQNDGYTLTSSIDGVDWVPEQTQGFPRRESGKLIRFNNKLWLLGGYDINNFDPLAPDLIWPTNAIYSSSDGINWMVAKEHAEFPAHPEYRLVEFNQKLWLFAGAKDLNRSTPPSEFTSGWVSSDAITWSQIGKLPFDSLKVANAVTWDNQMWVLIIKDKVGANTKREYEGEIWSSTDGEQWQKQPVPESLIEGAKLVVWADRLMVISPMQYAGRIFAWHLEGAEWQAHPLPNTPLTTYGFRVIPFADSLVVSLQSGLYLARSKDGINWQVNTSLSVAAGPIIRHKNSFISFFGKVLDQPEKPSIFQSTDGVNWKESAADLPIEPRVGPTLIAQDNRLWLYGGVDGKYNSVAGLWWSDDGKVWQREETTPDTSDTPPEGCRSSWSVPLTDSEDVDCIYDGTYFYYYKFSSVLLNDRPMFFKSRPVYFPDQLTVLGSVPEKVKNPAVDPYDLENSVGFGLSRLDFRQSKREDLVLKSLPELVRPVAKDNKVFALAGDVSSYKTPECYTSTNGVDWQKQLTDLPREFQYGGDLIINQGRFLVFANMNWGELTTFNDGGNDSNFSTALWSSEDCIHWKLELKRSFIPSPTNGTTLVSDGYFYHFNLGTYRSRDGQKWQRGYQLFERPQ